MGTQAVIAVQVGQSIKAVYTHWDGDKLLPVLQQNYSQKELARLLVSNGYISSLGERIDPIGKHSLDHPEPGTTVFYHRDRGDDLLTCRYEDLDELKNHVQVKHVYYYDTEWNKII